MHTNFPHKQQSSIHRLSFAHVFQASTVKQMIVDCDSLTIIDANEAACVFYGYAQTSLAGMSLLALMPNSQPKLSQQFLAQAPAIFDVCQTTNKYQHCIHIERSALLEDTAHQYELWTIIDLTTAHQSEDCYKRRYRYMLLLHELSITIMQQTNLEAVLEHLFTQVVTLINAPMGNLFLMNQEYSAMELRWSTFIPADQLGTAVVYGQGFIGQVWQAGQTMVLQDYSQSDLRQPHIECAIYACIGIPIFAEDTVVGVLSLAYDQPQYCFDEVEVEALQQVGKLASLAIERTQFYTTIEAELLERRLIEQSLRKLMERFQLIEDATASGIFDVDFVTDQIFTTVGFIETFGYSAVDLNTDASVWFSKVHRDDVDAITQGFQHALLYEDSFHASFRLRKADDRYCYVQGTVQLIRNTQGKVVRIVGSLIDVTERKNVEIAHSQSEERYRLSVEHAPYPIAVVSENQLVFANPILLELAHVQNTQELVNHSICRFIFDQLRRVEVDSLPEGEVRHLGISEYVAPPHEAMYLDLTAVGISYESRSAVLVIGHNVTRHLAAEEALRASAEQYRHMIEMAPMPIVVHAENRILYANLRAIRGAGLAADTNIAGYALQDFIAPEDHEKLAQYLHDRPPTCTLRMQTAKGHIRVIEVSSTEVLFGEQLVTQSAINDITSRINAEQDRLAFERRLYETQRLESLGVLAGGIAHDFNNLLVAILGNADLALEVLQQQDLDSDVYDIVQHIEQAARRASELTHQMLVYSGRSVKAMQAVNVGKLVVSILDLLRVSIAKTARLRCDIPDDMLIVRGDSAQLTQVIMNLVINASDALQSKPGQIGIELGNMWADQEYLDQLALTEPLNPGCYVYIDVSDTGAGMTQETQARMFDPFFTTKFTGRGLGLAAVQGIVRGHRGAIKVSSVVAQGTVIRLLLPCETLLQAHGVSVLPMIKETISQGTMLVIDDEPDVRTVVERILRRLGFDVLSAGDGHTGVELFKQHHASITGVLLDLTMPDIDGIATFHLLHEIDPQLRVILMSGYNEQQIMEQFHEQQLAGFLSKPFMISDLKARLTELLK